MGLLSQGSPLSWEETQKHAEHVRKHGILQFLHIYRAVRERHKDVLKWGDEVEYMLVAFDHEKKKARLSLIGEQVLHTLQEKGEKVNPNHPTLWRPEYGRYMIEGTPGQPYGGTMSEFNTVQDNMRKRRQEAASVLKENEALCTVTSFPRLGCPGFTIPESYPTPVEAGVSKSLFFPDEFRSIVTVFSILQTVKSLYIQMPNVALWLMPEDLRVVLQNNKAIFAINCHYASVQCSKKSCGTAIYTESPQSPFHWATVLCCFPDAAIVPFPDAAIVPNTAQQLTGFPHSRFP